VTALLGEHPGAVARVAARESVARRRPRD